MKFKLLSLFLATLAAIALPSWGAEPAKTLEPPADNASGATAKATPSQQELEENFAKELSGSTLAGHFSVDGRSGAPSEDRYTISKVTKLDGERWKFEVRIVYGQHDVTLPLPLTVKWAGDTPVLTLTDLAIPGLGTYTARVLIYRRQYAGTWSAGDHGGEMWGRIEKPTGGDPDKKKSDKKTDAADKDSDNKDN